MKVSSNDIFSLAETRLSWTGQRQTILSRNIANLTTPGFQASDARSFREMLRGATGVQPVRTAPGHLVGTIDPGMTARPTKDESARTADGNGVRLEDQLMKVADTESLHSTAASIYKKYMTMFTVALGRGT